MPNTSEANAKLGRTWLAAFNARDVSGLVSLYADDATHSSPKIRALHPQTGGKLLGRAAIRAWWEDAIVRLPTLRYEELSVTANDERVFLEYLRHASDGPPYPVAEVFEVRDGKVIASRVYHG
jgi:ketosteroid isomerase-like protein